MYEVVGQSLQDVDAFELGLDFLGQRGEVDLPGFLRLGLFLFGARLHLLPLRLQILGNGGAGELLFLDVGVHQPEAVLAGELPARATASVGRLVRAQEIAGTAIRLLAAPQALAKEDRLVLGDVQRGES